MGRATPELMVLGGMGSHGEQASKRRAQCRASDGGFQASGVFGMILMAGRA